MRAPPLFLALLVLPGCALGALLSPSRSIPDRAASTTLPGLEAAVTVTRDENGIAHVRAAHDADAWRAVGFLHAQDRLFQMDSLRRVAFGGVSEWVGSRGVELDGFMRGLELRGTVARNLAAMSAEERAVVDAYVAGVNAGAAALPALPLEYRVLGVDWAPWTAEDCFAALVLNAWTLAENPLVEVAALRLRGRADHGLLDALFRIDPTEPAVDADWDRVRALDIAPFGKGFTAFDAVFGGGDAAGASNNWIIGGEHTASGLPIVANDPHLTVGFPGVWYPIDVASPHTHVAGMSVAGAGVVVLGHNDRVAWGFTNVMADVVDFALVPMSGDTYTLEGATRTFRHVAVEVPVKGAPPEHRETLWTDAGPLVSTAAGGWGVVMRWGALTGEDRTLGLLLGLDHARSVDEALAATRVPSAIAQNLVVADVTGDYAWRPFGSVPRRVGFDGRVPYDASGTTRRWDGWLDPIPGERRPARGWVRSANARPDTTPEAWRYSTHYIASHRQDRIDQLVPLTPEHTVESVAAMQMDRLDLQAVGLAPRLLSGVTPATADGRRCHDVLRAWSGVSAPSSPGPTVWSVFQMELLRVALADELGDDIGHYLPAVSPGWSVLDGRLDAVVADRPAAVATALDHTCATLRERLGDDAADWAWGRVHRLHLDHPFGGASPLLASWNLPTQPWGGSDHTINAAGSRWGPWWAGGDEIPVGAIPSMRQIFPMDDLAHTRFALPGGVSGHVGDRHAADLLGDWLAGRTRVFWYDDADVAAHAVTRQTLTP